MIDTADWIVLVTNVVCGGAGCLAFHSATKKERALRNAEPAWKREKRERLMGLSKAWAAKAENAPTYSWADEYKSRLDEVLEELRMLDDADPLANEIDSLVRRAEKVRPK